MNILDSIRGAFAKPYDSVSAAEAQRQAGEGAVLLDVREQQEWAAGHADGARHIPLGQLPRRLRELPDRPVITVCRSGARSAQAAGLLAGHGHTVLNLRGGMRAWDAAGLPVVGKGGRPGTFI